MTVLYFLTDDETLLVDGKPLSDRVYRREEETFDCFVQVSASIPYVVPVSICLQVRDGRVRPSPYLHCVDCGNREYFVSFVPARTDEMYRPDVTWQLQSCCNNVCHCATLYRQGGLFRASIETETETVCIDLPCELCNPSFQSVGLHRGQLLCLQGDCACKKFFAVFYYDTDYSLLLNVVCDAVAATDDGVMLTDYLDDMAGHTVIRTLSYREEGYVEQFRDHTCRKSVHCIPELIPYLFCESLSCGDTDTCRSLCTSMMEQTDFQSLFGSFYAICDDARMTYRPYCIRLIYRSQPHDLLKTFRFDLHNGLIARITCIS